MNGKQSLWGERFIAEDQEGDEDVGCPYAGQNDTLMIVFFDKASNKIQFLSLLVADNNSFSFFFFFFFFFFNFFLTFKRSDLSQPYQIHPCGMDMARQPRRYVLSSR